MKSADRVLRILWRASLRLLQILVALCLLGFIALALTATLVSCEVIKPLGH